jgi:flagellar biosynthesis/type III secretory pathway M-ring protein FliF/YscJ
LSSSFLGLQFIWFNTDIYKDNAQPGLQVGSGATCAFIAIGFYFIVFWIVWFLPETPAEEEEGGEKKKKGKKGKKDEEEEEVGDEEEGQPQVTEPPTTQNA